MDLFQEKPKPFFDLLHPRQAFILGCVTSFLVMGTVGFFLLGAYLVRGSAMGAKGFPVATAGNKDINQPVVVNTAKTGTGDVAAVQPAGKVPPISESDHIFGDPKAPITIIEYSDFQCPYCVNFHPTMEQVMEQYKGKVKWVYRHYPLSFHPQSQPAAEASECASEQGKFWEYAKGLFENQKSLGAEFYSKLAGDIGLNVSTFNTCLESDKYLSHIQQDLEGGSGAGVRGTPGSFLIDKDGNAQAIKGALPFSSIQPLIDEALQ